MDTIKCWRVTFAVRVAADQKGDVAAGTLQYKLNGFVTLLRKSRSTALGQYL